MIRRQPNLLLLDEPTNHLDLEMRLALSRALVDYAGAIVVISHDRHLLRTVCDDLIVVHAGKVERFAGSLDDYPAWLAEQRSTPTTTQPATGSDGPKQGTTPAASPSPSRKLQRQLEARRRQALKPLTDRVRGIEQRLVECRKALTALERELAEPALYSEPGRKDELTALLCRRAEVSSRIDALETNWLEASEELERHSTGLAGDG